MLGLLVFVIPAVWLGYVAGWVVREGLAALLYYRLADVTPWLLQHWDNVVMVALGLGILGNLFLTTRIKWGKWTRALWALGVTGFGASLWLVACMLNPDWWLAPFGGLVVFPLMVAGPVAAFMAHHAMCRDELVEVLGWMLLFTGLTALTHAGVWLWLG